jgi:hypothetical protein
VTDVLGPPGQPADEPTAQVVVAARPSRRGRRAWAALVLAMIMVAPLIALGLLVKFAPNRLSMVNPAPSVPDPPHNHRSRQPAGRCHRHSHLRLRSYLVGAGAERHRDGY